jgi:hypothetical protein
MSFERSFQCPAQKPWSSNSTRTAQSPLAPLIQSTMKQSPSTQVDGFNGAHQEDIAFHADALVATTHETPDEPLQSQRRNDSCLVPDCYVYMDPRCGQPLLQKINGARDYFDIQQKVHFEHKPDIKFRPLHGRQNGDIRYKPRRTFMIHKHELPEIIENETSSAADSSAHDDPPKECTTPCYKYRQSSGKHFDELVKSGRTQVNSRTETVVPQYHPKYSSSSNEARVGTAVSYTRRTRTDRYRGERKSYPMIEVAPGNFLRLRGAEETWHAIQNDFYSPCICLCCEETLFCIENASYVLCPACRVVSPLEQCHDGESEGGVGLGFTMENLAKWQREVLQEYDAI